MVTVMYCKYVWLTLIISDTREAVKRWSNFTASFSKTSCKKAKLLHKIETRYRSHKFVFRRPNLSHAYTWRLPLEQYCEITQIFGDSTQAPMKGFRLSCLISLIWKEKKEINNPTYVQKCTTRTLDTSYWTKLFVFSIWRHVWQNCLHFVEGLGKGHFVISIMSPMKGNPNSEIREIVACGIWNSGSLMLLESGIQLKESGIPLVCHTAVFSVVTLRHDTKNGCVAD